MSKKMTDENSKLAAKRTLCVILTVLVGYILLGIPYVKFAVEVVVLFMVMRILFDFYGYLFSELNREKEKKANRQEP